jgi:hypothetical protein
MSVLPSVRVAGCLAVAAVSLALARTVVACEIQPDLHIEVTSKFDVAAVRNDYSLAEIVAFARQQHRDAGRALLGFYTSEFEYTIDLVPEGDPICPAQIDATVTLQVQHRLIEIGREAAASSCVYPSALRHYHRLAQIDEQVIERFVATTATMLAQASPHLKLTQAAHPEDLNVALRGQIRSVVEAAIAPLHVARQDAQQAVNNSGELKQLASSCSI